MSQALQALIDEGAGGTVHLPPGVHEVSSTLTIPPETRVLGSGWDCCLCSKWISEAPIIQTADGAGQELGHLVVAGSFRKRAICVQLNAARECYVHDIGILNHGDALVIKGMRGTVIERVNVYPGWLRQRYKHLDVMSPSQVGVGVRIEGGDPEYRAALGCTLRDIRINRATHGYEIRNVGDGTVTDVAIEGGWVQFTSGAAIHVNSPARRVNNLEIRRTRFEQLDKEFLDTAQTRDDAGNPVGGIDVLTVDGCVVQSSVSGTYPDMRLWQCQRLRMRRTRALQTLSMGVADYDADIDALSHVVTVQQ